MGSHGSGGDAEATESSPCRSLADKLNRLFRTAYANDRGYGVADVVEAIRDRGGPTISAAYVYQLRNGQRDNPTKHHMEALADVFGVSPAYFFHDDGAEGDDPAVAAALRNPTIRQLVLDLAALSSGSVQAVAGVVRHLRTLEQTAPRLPARGRHRRPAHRAVRLNG